jgi:hypothetical protein
MLGVCSTRHPQRISLSHTLIAYLVPALGMVLSWYSNIRSVLSNRAKYDVPNYCPTVGILDDLPDVQAYGHWHITISP